MQFGHLILFEFFTTERQILGLKCTKLNFDWGCAVDPAGGAYSASQTF